MTKGMIKLQERVKKIIEKNGYSDTMLKFIEENAEKMSIAECSCIVNGWTVYPSATMKEIKIFKENVKYSFNYRFIYRELGIENIEFLFKNEIDPFIVDTFFSIWNYSLAYLNCERCFVSLKDCQQAAQQLDAILKKTCPAYEKNHFRLTLEETLEVYIKHNKTVDGYANFIKEYAIGLFLNNDYHYRYDTKQYLDVCIKNGWSFEEAKSINPDFDYKTYRQNIYDNNLKYITQTANEMGIRSEGEFEPLINNWSSPKKDAVEILIQNGIEGTIKAPGIAITSYDKATDNNDYFEMKLQIGQSIHIYCDERYTPGFYTENGYNEPTTEDRWLVSIIGDTYTFRFTTKNTVYLRKNAGKSHPATLKDVFKIYHAALKRAGNDTKITDSFLDIIFTYIKHNNSNIAKDLKPYFESKIFLPPITLHDIIKCHNMAELMENYQTRQNANKRDANMIYLTYLALPYLDEKSQEVMQNKKSVDFITPEYMQLSAKYIRKNQYRSLIKRFLVDYYLDKFAPQIRKNDQIYKNELMIAIQDYIKIALTGKVRISLNKTSIQKINDATFQISLDNDDYMKNKKIKVQVPKNSRFNNLRNILPEEFEWIKDKKRLYTEGKSMHHCVSSYYKRINRDTSAIYSLWYKPEHKRYTIEFKKAATSKRNDNYYVAQIQSMCDRGSSPEVRLYVHSLLNPDDKPGENFISI